MTQIRPLKKEKNLELLVDELLKAKPSQKTIQQLTQELGIGYSEDVIHQMSIVLEATSSLMSHINNKKSEQSGGTNV